MSLLSDTRLGHYQIREKLGAGGMGEVYLAEDTKLNRKVAVKFLSPESTADPRAKRRLMREAQAAAALDHPNICAIHEVREEHGHTFIVMQYVEGETLAARIQRKPLELLEALGFAVSVADALAEAHSRGVIHRDIKPQNIMITTRGQVKILDFGLARLIANKGLLDREAETQSLVTEAGVIVGTIPYMSPEQVKGEALDTRSDVFSFGAVLYEMISAHRAFAAKTVAEIISAILMSEPATLASYPIALPARLEQILRKCLEKDRERRYQSMREVAHDLESVRRECETGATVVQTVDSSAATIRVEAPNHVGQTRAFLSSRLGLGLVALVMLAAVASGAALIFRNSQAPSSNDKSVNSPASDYYLRGKVNVSSENPENNQKAIKLLEQAVTADPNFAPAYAELARAYHVKAFYFASKAEEKKLTEDAEVAVEKALALDSNLAEAYLARGLILWTHAKRFPHEQSIQSYKRALALNPNLDEARHQLGLVYLHIGLLDKGRDETEKALAVNPANTGARFRLGVAHLYRGKYEEALAFFKSTPPDRNHALWAFQTAIALFQLGRTQEASKVVEEYLLTYSTDEGGTVTSVKAMILAKAGREREAEEAIQRAIEVGAGFGHFHHTAYNIALTYAMLNRPEPAVKWLEVSADDGFPCYPLFENDASLNSLRKDERFITFMAKMKRQWERYSATL